MKRFIMLRHGSKFEVFDRKTERLIDTFNNMNFAIDMVRFLNNGERHV